MDEEGLEEDVQNLLRGASRKTALCELHRWITECRVMPPKAWRKHVMRTDKEEDLPQSRQKVIGRIWNQVLDDDEARNVFIKNSMWRSNDFLIHVVWQNGRKRSHHVHLCL